MQGVRRRSGRRWGAGVSPGLEIRCAEEIMTVVMVAADVPSRADDVHDAACGGVT